MSISRTTLKDLIKSGAIKVDDAIMMNISRGKVIKATITSNAKIQLESGEMFDTPSAAARFVRNGVSTNGWATWRLQSNGTQLGKLRP